MSYEFRIDDVTAIPAVCRCGSRTFFLGPTSLGRCRIQCAACGARYDDTRRCEHGIEVAAYCPECGFRAEGGGTVA
jgi:DNA-directed RNA polymerase subunit RPC12/RpoP